MAGATETAQPVDEEIVALITPLRDAAQQAAQATGWNGLFAEFTPVSYAAQTVAGKNYFVKVKVGEDKYVHVRAFQPLPHTGLPIEVAAVQVDKSADDPVVHF
eukprot:m.30967 g.30967  ORF g.30967 m.30967 type:complete len:103 (-) comp9601_c0_seq1:173-481(-)